MNEQQKRLVEMLNDMYHSQDKEYKSLYRDYYFELLQYIINGEKIIKLNSGSRWFEDITKWKGNE